MTRHPALHRITSHAELRTVTDDDPFVRWGVPDPLTGVVLRGEGALGIERVGRRGRGMWVLPHSGGGGPQVRAFLADLASGPVSDLGLENLSVPRSYAEELASVFEIGPGGDWDWMWIDRQPPTVPLEEDLVVLDDTADAEEIAQLSQAHSPTGEGDPGTGRTRLWLGLRDQDGALVAVGAQQTLDTGVPHLAGIVTHADHRGRGLGRAVTAGLTREAVARLGVCTLGMYSANPPARAVYVGLGYRTAYAWHSRRLLGIH